MDFIRAFKIMSNKLIVNIYTGKATSRVVTASEAIDFAKPVVSAAAQANAELRLTKDAAIEALLEIEGRKGAGDAAVKDYITKRDQKRTPK